MRGESQYCRGPAGYGYADEDEGYWYRQGQVPAGWEYRDDEDDHGRADGATGGAEGNKRLTGLTGMVLLVLFAAEGFTILAGSDLARRAGYRADQVLDGRTARWLLLSAALLTGLLLAVITVHLAGPRAAVPGPGR